MDEQIIRIHAPYEDAIIAGCELVTKVIEGQDPATKKLLWERHIEVTQPWHNVAVEAAKNLEKFIGTVFKPR